MTCIINFVANAGSAAVVGAGHLSRFSGKTAKICCITALGSAALAGLSTLGAQVGYLGSSCLSALTAGKLTTLTAIFTSPKLMTFAIFALKASAATTVAAVAFGTVAIVLLPCRPFAK